VDSDGGVAAGALAGNIATLRPRVERPLELRNRLLIRCALNRASIQYVSFWHQTVMPVLSLQVRYEGIGYRTDRGAVKLDAMRPDPRWGGGIFPGVLFGNAGAFPQCGYQHDPYVSPWHETDEIG
jgi:hypothetical protein